MTDEERRKSHTKASNKYNQKNYKQIKANIKPHIYNTIDEYCSNNGVSKAQLITAGCLYIINNNIDISDISTD